MCLCVHVSEWVSRAGRPAGVDNSCSVAARAWAAFICTLRATPGAQLFECARRAFFTEGTEKMSKAYAGNSNRVVCGLDNYEMFNCLETFSLKITSWKIATYSFVILLDLASWRDDIGRLRYFAVTLLGESQMEQLTKELDHSCCYMNVSTKAIFSFGPVEFIDKLLRRGEFHYTHKQWKNDRWCRQMISAVSISRSNLSPNFGQFVGY